MPTKHTESQTVTEESKITQPTITNSIMTQTSSHELTNSLLIHQTLTARKRKVRFRVLLLAFLAIAFSSFFATYDALAYWEIIGPLRLPRLLGLIVVATALSASTVVFQVVTQNRILSPSIMGFDSLYRLIATLLIFCFTSEVVELWNPTAVFAIQAGLMMLGAVILFTSMIRRGSDRIHVLVLVGIVFGTLLRSITAMLSAIMDPNEFQNVQDLGMASFATINQPALLITSLITIAALCVIMWQAHDWNVLALGRTIAIPLGLNYTRAVKIALGISSLLVACATALVGPLMFFGLLVVNIAVYILRSDALEYLIPGSIFIGICVLVGGQAVLEFVLDQSTVLPVVLEFVGGVLLLTLILKEVRS
ncbi:iron chelate uptake ABC transporter family permease subunit [Arcanobacterium hippocoleae]|uniref:Iron complex transport system permease protein n=1 Tax=Arcanobacterium hippocoleae TaxID=149017 RepID=A0ABU1T330_9ACTO|nr:iron chelate uptake ABC transporter family permease subunit [Arcanobacterium hippocoleae]MDR6939787.1 iron complex transport system permease protein [Arcanobacterium hippocoleae]